MAQSKVVPVLLTILVIIAAGVVCYFLESIITPFLVAIFLSILLEPLMEGLRRLKIPKGLAVLFILLLTFSFLFLLGLLIYASITTFTDEFPVYEKKFVTLFQNLLQWLNIPLEDLNTYIKNFDWASAIKDLSLPSYVSSGVGTFFQFLGNVFLVLIFMVYALLGKEALFTRIEKAFAAGHSAQIAKTMETINRQIQKYLVAKTIISLAVGLLTTVILLFFGVPFAFIWGLITFFLNYIPNIGAIVASVLPVLVAVLQFGSVWRPLWIAVSLLLLHMAVGNIVEPKIMGKSLDLSPLVVILFLIFWGFLWGIIGMILAVPIAAAIKIVTANIKPLQPISILMSGK